MIKRLITGGILIGVGLYTVISGGLPLFLWVVSCGLLVSYEMYTLSGETSLSLKTVIGHVAVGVVICSAYWMDAAYWNTPFVKLVVVGGLLYFGVELIQKRLLLKEVSWIRFLRITCLSGLCLSYVILLRNLPNGLAFTWFCFLSIWVADTFALFGGKLVGKHPLSSISPNKTIEGTLIGSIGSMIAAGVLSYFYGFSLYIAVPFALFLSLVSQLGDLHESLYKRSYDKKDSSSLLPGHGGFYDRADSTLFVFPLAYYLFPLLPL